MDTLSFKKRCALLTVSVLRTRTPFAKFLLSTLHLPRGSLASASPAFPLPMPFPGVFARMPPGLSSAKRCRIINFRRALHVVAMALSFWFAGSCFVPREHLERALSKNQHAILHRLSGLLLADGLLRILRFLVVVAGFHSSSPAFVSDCLTKLGVGAGPYEKTFPGHSVPMDTARFPELEP